MANRSQQTQNGYSSDSELRRKLYITSIPTHKKESNVNGIVDVAAGDFQ